MISYYALLWTQTDNVDKDKHKCYNENKGNKTNMSDNNTSDPINYHDDNRVLRYLLHNVHGISAVSGGVLGDALEEEYRTAEEESRPEQDIDLDFEPES